MHSVASVWSRRWDLLVFVGELHGGVGVRLKDGDARASMICTWFVGCRRTCRWCTDGLHGAWSGSERMQRPVGAIHGALHHLLVESLLYLALLTSSRSS